MHVEESHSMDGEISVPARWAREAVAGITHRPFRSRGEGHRAALQEPRRNLQKVLSISAAAADCFDPNIPGGRR
jgi:hypothetical protein